MGRLILDADNPDYIDVGYDLRLSGAQLDVVRKALRRQAQKHRGTEKGNRYDEVCSEIEEQVGLGTVALPGLAEAEHWDAVGQEVGRMAEDAHWDSVDQELGHMQAAAEDDADDIEEAERRFRERRAMETMRAPPVRPMPRRVERVERLKQPTPRLKPLPEPTPVDRWLKSTTVQTLLLDREQFTRKQAVEWARIHGFVASKVDATENYWRIRQRDPRLFRDDTFRTIDFRPGVKAVVGVPST